VSPYTSHEFFTLTSWVTSYSVDLWEVLALNRRLVALLSLQANIWSESVRVNFSYAGLPSCLLCFYLPFLFAFFIIHFTFVFLPYSSFRYLYYYLSFYFFSFPQSRANNRNSTTYKHKQQTAINICLCACNKKDRKLFRCHKLYTKEMHYIFTLYSLFCNP
jgi:hypothetical protein